MTTTHNNLRRHLESQLPMAQEQSVYIRRPGSAWLVVSATGVVLYRIWPLEGSTTTTTTTPRDDRANTACHGLMARQPLYCRTLHRPALSLVQSRRCELRWACHYEWFCWPTNLNRCALSLRSCILQSIQHTAYIFRLITLLSIKVIPCKTAALMCQISHSGIIQLIKEIERKTKNDYGVLVLNWMLSA